jgi:hypothetical protein
MPPPPSTGVLGTPGAAPYPIKGDTQAPARRHRKTAPPAAQRRRRTKTSRAPPACAPRRRFAGWEHPGANRPHREHPLVETNPFRRSPSPETYRTAAAA